jgi:hypothetical protein
MLAYDTDSLKKRNFSSLEKFKMLGKIAHILPPVHLSHYNNNKPDNISKDKIGKLGNRNRFFQKIPWTFIHNVQNYVENFKGEEKEEKEEKEVKEEDNAEDVQEKSLTLEMFFNSIFKIQQTDREYNLTYTDFAKTIYTNTVPNRTQNINPPNPTRHTISQLFRILKLTTSPDNTQRIVRLPDNTHNYVSSWYIIMIKYLLDNCSNIVCLDNVFKDDNDVPADHGIVQNFHEDVVVTVCTRCVRFFFFASLKIYKSLNKYQNTLLNRTELDAQLYDWIVIKKMYETLDGFRLLYRHVEHNRETFIRFCKKK